MYKGNPEGTTTNSLSTKYTSNTSICTIPQLDGDQDHVPTPSLPFKQQECDNCHEVFENETKLEEHNDKYKFGCEDCNMCFTSKLKYDFHELEKHSESSYVQDLIPPTTKLQFAAGYR